jgi:fructokinase
MRIGIDLGGTKIEGIVMDDAGRERVRRRVPTPKGDYRATVEAIALLVAALEPGSGPVVPRSASAFRARSRASAGA